MAKRPTWYKTDVQLSARMFLTMLLLGVLYTAFIVVLWYLGVNFILLLVIAAVILGIQLFYTDKIALFAMNAREVSPEEAPQLHAIIDRLAAQANLPKPKVAIVNTNLPNAFATGRSKKHAVIAVTTGLLDRLNTQELEAVLAHELTHIVNRDMVVMTIAMFLSMVASLLVNSLMWGAFLGGGYGGGRRGGRDNDGGNVFILVWMVSIVVYALSFILIRTLSRYREYAADRGSALITGEPGNLASALMHIEGSIASGRIPDRDLRQAQGVSALMIMPLRGQGGLEIFSTHPSLEHRIERLQRIQKQMEAPR